MDVNDLLSTGVVAAVIVLIFLSTVRRMLDLRRFPCSCGLSCCWPEPCPASWPTPS